MSQSVRSDPRKNILFIITDQQRRDSLRCYGNDIVHTPVTDLLAQTGTRFDNFFTPTAICTPARASLLTGLLPFRHKLLANYEWNSGCLEELPEGLPSLARLLQGAGYRTGHIGKWHVGHERGPDFYGFDGDHFPGPLNPVDHPLYVDWLNEHNYPLFGVGESIEGRFPDGRVGHLMAARLEQPVEATFEAFLVHKAVELLEEYAGTYRETGQPFYLALDFFGPHLPYLLPDDYFDLYNTDDITLPPSFKEAFEGKPPVQRRYSEYWTTDSFTTAQWKKIWAVYWGYVTMIEDLLARVVKRLQDLEIWDDTVICFTTDHGEFTGAHRLNDKGPAMYDDIYRIPALVRHPEGGAQAEERFADLLDMHATILEIAGVADHGGGDGKSLLGLVLGDEPANWRTAQVSEFHGHHFAYQQRMIRTKTHKLIINPESYNELYDLVEDPSELLNVYKVPRYDQVRKEMELALFDELRVRGDKFFQWMNFMCDIDWTHRTQLSTSLESKIKPKV